MQSYNWPNQMLHDQDYMSCFRQEQGYCDITYQQATDPTSTPRSFDLYGIADSVATANVQDVR